MNRPTRIESPKRATNVSLIADIVDDAKRLGVNVSEACQKGLTAEVKKAREAKWLEENRAALESSNAYVEKFGLPLARYRLF
jgi:antitoxin CcdA